MGGALLSVDGRRGVVVFVHAPAACVQEHGRPRRDDERRRQGHHPCGKARDEEVEQPARDGAADQRAGVKRRLARAEGPLPKREVPRDADAEKRASKGRSLAENPFRKRRGCCGDNDEQGEHGIDRGLAENGLVVSSATQRKERPCEEGQAVGQVLGKRERRCGIGAGGFRQEGRRGTRPSDERYQSDLQAVADGGKDEEGEAADLARTEKADEKAAVFLEHARCDILGRGGGLLRARTPRRHEHAPDPC